MSSARLTARSTYWAKSETIVSVSPTLERFASECRLENVSPGHVTIGTPIHRASQVVVLPLYVMSGGHEPIMATWVTSDFT